VSSQGTALEGFRWWLVSHRGNGLTDDTWVPMFCVDRRIVDPLLTELRRAGVPARCTRLGASWHLPAHPGEWCLWVGYAAYVRAQERLAEVMPLLVRSLRHRTGTG
jgi:hypothetical protein